MWFSPIIPRTGEAIIEANRVFSEAARDLGMPLFRTFTLPACFWERSFIFILATPVTEDPAVNKRYREGFKKLIEIGGQVPDHPGQEGPVRAGDLHHDG